MALEADLLTDRMVLKRHLTVWRALAILAVCLALIAGAGSRRGGLAVTRHIARVSVDGLITDDRAKVARIRSLGSDSSVSAVILSIDSPGGSVAGGEALHDALAYVASRKPMVCVMRGEAASAGYMIAVVAPHILARQSTITGSIGVLMQTGEISGLLGKIGVSSTMIVSGPLKGQPDPAVPLSPAAHQYLQGLIDDLYDQFIGIVAAGRHMDPAAVRRVADGRAYTGRQALALKLIDGYGGEAEAQAWLVATYHLPSTQPIVEAGQPPRTWRSRFGLGQDSSSGLFGGLIDALSPGGITLSGPLAVWQPDR